VRVSIKLASRAIGFEGWLYYNAIFYHEGHEVHKDLGKMIKLFFEVFVIFVV
jgi:hypothetical protein